MKKKVLLAIPFVLSALLIGCGKSGKNDTSVTDTSDYILTDTTEKTGSDGKLKRTYTFVNSEKEISFTYNVLNNFSMENFYYGTSLITNDSYGYDRYMVVDTSGNEIIKYDSYDYMERLEHLPYFIVTTDKEAGELVGLISETGSSVVPEKYNDISLYPADDKIMYLCDKGENIYDIRSENGDIIAEDVTIGNTTDCGYVESPFSSGNYGILCISSGTGYSYISEKDGSTVIEHADYYDENIFDYYKTSASEGDVQLGFFNNNGTKFYPVSEDYSNCRIFATSDYRYVYDSSDIIVATYSSGGSLVGSSDKGEILHPMLYGKNHTFIIETESAYILKDSDDNQVEKFSKDSCTLTSSSDYGFVIVKDDVGTVYSLSGKKLYSDLTVTDRLYIDENTYLADIYGYLVPLDINELVTYQSEKGFCITENQSEGKLYIKDSSKTLSEYNSADFLNLIHTEDDSIFLIETTNGLFNINGNAIKSAVEE